MPTVPQGPKSPISIHALLAESDCPPTPHAGQTGIFLSTLSLRRATPGIQRLVALLRQFLSTLSLRRATFLPAVACQCDAISIHALLAESDESQQLCARPTRDFYPRSPCGERQEEKSQADTTGTISIHALLAESDAYT